MTNQEREIIRSTIHTLIELTYGMMKEKAGLTQEKITLLEEYEESLKTNINRLLE